MGFEKFCKVMAIENAIVPDMESFVNKGKKIFRMDKSFGFLLEKLPETSQKAVSYTMYYIILYYIILYYITLYYIILCYIIL